MKRSKNVNSPSGPTVKRNTKLNRDDCTAETDRATSCQQNVQPMDSEEDIPVQESPEKDQVELESSSSSSDPNDLYSNQDFDYEDSWGSDISDHENNNNADESDSSLSSSFDAAALRDANDKDANVDNGNWEGPPSFLADLEHLRVQQSVQKNLRPLQQLTLKCISNNLNFFQRQHPEPFSILPGEVLELLTRFLEGEGCLDGPQFLPLVISKRSRFLSVNCTKPPRYRGDRSTIFLTEDFAAIFAKISNLCKDSMLELHLMLDHRGLMRSASFPSLSDVHASLASMTNLRELCLDLGDVTDQTLRVLATHCQQLRKLDVAVNANVTDLGLEFLCLPEKPGDGCRALEYLDVCCTSVTRVGLLIALTNLPGLTHLEHEHILSAISLFVDSYRGTKPLNLEEYFVSTKHRNKLQRKNLDCKDMAFMTNIKSLRLEYMPEIDHIKLQKHVTELICGERVSSYDIIHVSCQFGSNLTKLELASCSTSLCLKAIVDHCVNLESLKCKFPFELSEIDYEYELNQNKLKHLKYLNLSWESKSHFFPENILKCILSSHCLERIEISESKIASNMLANLIEKAKTHKEIFSNLSSLSLRACKIQFERVKQLICVAPRLETLTVFGCRDPVDVWFSCQNPFGSFISRNKIQLCFNPAIKSCRQNF